MSSINQRKVHPPAGSRPGTLVIPVDSVAPRIAVINYDSTAIVERTLESPDDLESLRSPQPQSWVDVQGLGSERMLRAIGEIFSLHPLALEDVVHLPQRPKTELYEGSQFFTTRMMRIDEEDKLDVEQVSLFLGRGWLLTFQERYGDVLDPVRDRLRRGGGPIRQIGTDYLAYAIIDTIIDQYFPVVERIGDRLEELEEEVLESPGQRVLSEINRIRRDLLIIRRAVWPQREAISEILRGESPMFDPQVLTYLRDTYDHLIQLTDVVESYRDLASGLMQTYLSVVGNRTNEVMKVLTIMASIFIPLTFIAGIYGMNFAHMPELSRPWAYPAALVLMLAVGLGMVWYFWRKGWIGGR